nr:5-deoxy-glucuronate isomerase [Bacteroidales bacterium]
QHKEMKPVNIKSKQMNREYTPEELGLCFTSVQRHSIDDIFEFETEEKEHAIVMLRGNTVIHCADQVFTLGPLDTLYLPRHISVIIEGDKAQFMRYAAPSDRDIPPKLFPFSEIDSNPNVHNTFGSLKDGTGREVWKIMNDDFPCSRLMIGVCKGEPGCWTAWPPHRHGKQREEVYYYFDMNDSFAVQLIYQDLDNPDLVAIVQDGDLVSIPSGYHPNLGSPAGGISYIYCMVATQAGERNFMDLEIQEKYKEQFAGDMK